MLAAIESIWLQESRLLPLVCFVRTFSLMGHFPGEANSRRECFR